MATRLPTATALKTVKVRVYTDEHLRKYHVVARPMGRLGRAPTAAEAVAVARLVHDRIVHDLTDGLERLRDWSPTCSDSVFMRVYLPYPPHPRTGAERWACVLVLFADGEVDHDYTVTTRRRLPALER